MEFAILCSCISVYLVRIMSRKRVFLSRFEGDMGEGERVVLPDIAREKRLKNGLNIHNPSERLAVHQNLRSKKTPVMSIVPSNFQARTPNFSEKLVVNSAPSTTGNGPYRIPTPSVRSKVPEMMTNMPCRSHLRSIPFRDGWEQNYSVGMPLFVNSKKSRGTDAAIVTTPATVNFLAEEGARIVHEANHATNKRLKNNLTEDYNSRSHLYPNTIEEFSSLYRPFGAIYTITGKDSESGLAVSGPAPDGMFYTCTVSKTADLLNFWGPVRDGDVIGWVVGMKKNVYQYFYDPNGRIVGPSSLSPEYFMQIVPVSWGPQGDTPSHNTNWKNLDEPARTDIDFLSPMSIEQEDMRMNFSTGKFETVPLNLKNTPLKTKDISFNMYCMGRYIRVGRVNKGVRGHGKARESFVFFFARISPLSDD